MLQNLKKELNKYIDDVVDDIIADLDMSEDEIYYSNELKDTIEEELTKKGFSKEEAQEVSIKSLSNETAYKFLSYAYQLYNDYHTVDELKKIITDFSESNIEDFTDEDINQIYKYSLKLN